jgi:hypothetical protein
VGIEMPTFLPPPLLELVLLVLLVLLSPPQAVSDSTITDAKAKASSLENFFIAEFLLFIVA